MGYTYGEKLDAAFESGLIKLERINKEGANFSKLIAGRVDLVIASLEIGQEFLKNNMTPEEAALLTYHQKPARISGYHLLLTKALEGNKALMDKFDEGLKKIKADGLFDKINADMKAGKYKP
ncbi:MAG: amino acid ABC transporter substrate-binding protein [bacterium]|nr:amino acid ABC transporter substrate-binding protein [bacterium]